MQWLWRKQVQLSIIVCDRLYIPSNFCKSATRCLFRCRRQFPTDETSQDTLKTTIDLVTDQSKRIVTDLGVTKAVREKLAAYKAAQDAIRSSSLEVACCCHSRYMC